MIFFEKSYQIVMALAFLCYRHPNTLGDQFFSKSKYNYGVTEGISQTGVKINIFAYNFLIARVRKVIFMSIPTNSTMSIPIKQLPSVQKINFHHLV